MMLGHGSPMGLLDGAGMSILTLFVGGLILLVALGLLRGVLALIRLSKSQRDMVDRGTPLVAAIAGLLYVLFSLRFLFKGYPNYSPVILTLVVAGAVAASWFAIRDVVSGVLLQAGRVCRVGDHVRINDVQGRVRRMGLRVMAIETSLGEEALVPYSRVARESVVRTAIGGDVALHNFRVDVPEEVPMSDARRVIREGAWRSHWSSLGREPQLALVDERKLEVTVFSISPDRAPEIESEVRSALAERVERDR
jgi:small-conductance mechanosensitive channel